MDQIPRDQVERIACIVGPSSAAQKCLDWERDNEECVFLQDRWFMFPIPVRLLKNERPALDDQADGA